MAELQGPVVVRCAVCGESVTLDRSVPVAAAEISLFIETHARHDGMRIDVAIRGDATRRDPAGGDPAGGGPARNDPARNDPGRDAPAGGDGPVQDSGGE